MLKHVFGFALMIVLGSLTGGCLAKHHRPIRPQEISVNIPMPEVCKTYEMYWHKMSGSPPLGVQRCI